MEQFTVYPAIDLRGGEVVRFKQGDPNRKTSYHRDAAAVARRWLSEGADWLHVINMDAVFGVADKANRAALKAILETGAQVQLGGGLRSMRALESALELGVQRVVIGTAAVEKPRLMRQAVKKFGADRLAVSLDIRWGHVRVRGWVQDGGIDALSLAERLSGDGVETIIVTDIKRDGMGSGVNIDLAQRLADETEMAVIASGGVNSLEDVRRVRRAALQGVIVGRALYEGNFSLEEALRC